MRACVRQRKILVYVSVYTHALARVVRPESMVLEASDERSQISTTTDALFSGLLWIDCAAVENACAHDYLIHTNEGKVMIRACVDMFIPGGLCQRFDLFKLG